MIFTKIESETMNIEKFIKQINYLKNEKEIIEKDLY